MTRAGATPAVDPDGSRPDPGPSGYRAARAGSSRASPPPVPRAGREPDVGDARRGLEDRRRRRAARRGRGRARPPRREPRPGGRGEGAGGAGRPLAPRRAAAVEQGAPRARGLRCHPVGRLGRARRAARSARPRDRGPARATRSCSRSTSTSTRPRPASRPDAVDAAMAELAGAAAPRGPRADDDRPADRRPGEARDDLRAACASCRALPVDAGRSSARSCRWA